MSLLSDVMLADIAKIVSSQDIKKFGREVLNMDDSTINECIGKPSYYERNYHALSTWASQNGHNLGNLRNIFEDASKSDIYLRDGFIILRDAKQGFYISIKYIQ